MPRKKRKVDSSQLQISFGTLTAPELCIVQQSTTKNQDAVATDRLRSSSVKWQDKYLWLQVKGDGVYYVGQC